MITNQVTGLHYMNVIPNLPQFREVYDSFRLYGRQDMDVVLESEVNPGNAKDLTNRHDMCFIFWGKIPGWFPAKTNARVILMFTHSVHNLRGALPDQATFLESFRKASYRPDIVVFPDSETSENLRNFCKRRWIFFPYLFCSDIFGTPFRVEKQWKVCFYGKMTPRRRVIFETVQKVYGQKAIYFKAFGKERKEILDKSFVSLHVNSSKSFGVNPLRYHEAASSNSYMVVEDPKDMPFREYYAFNSLERPEEKSYLNLFMDRLENAIRMSKDNMLRESLHVRMQSSYHINNFVPELLQSIPLRAMPELQFQEAEEEEDE